ncbi:MAG TPA: hypothetical protein VG675_09745 [Bryobacteraceae bacterium]|nr:hypothetical protein [Bryobacteraceae bacterium]
MEQATNFAPRTRHRATLFAIGDITFLMLTGSATNAAMMAIHAVQWNCLATVSVGMVAAMAVQMIAATLAAPILGSIETMVPSMLVGMSSPMLICFADALGIRTTYASAVSLGAIFGAFVFVVLSCWHRKHLPAGSSAQ